MRMPPSHVVPFRPRSGSFRDVLSAVGAAVIAEEEHEGRLFETGVVELAEDRADRVIQGREHAGERPPPRIVDLREAVAVLGRRLQRAVDRVEGEIQEKGLGTVLIDTVPINTVSVDAVTIDTALINTVTLTVTINTVAINTVAINTVAIDERERLAAEGVGEVLGFFHVFGAADDFAAAPSIRHVDVQAAEEAEELVKAGARSAVDPREPRCQLPTRPVA